MRKFDPTPFSLLLSQIKEKAKKLSRATGKKHKVLLEELTRDHGYHCYDTLRLFAIEEQRSRHAPSRLVGAVADIPAPVPELAGIAVCRTPNELRVLHQSLGAPTYAIKIDEDVIADRWYFANNLQDAVAIGLCWNQRGCAVEQYPMKQDDEVIFWCRLKHLPDVDLEDRLNEDWLWEIAGANPNLMATPEILTRVRCALFEFVCTSPPSFLMLDFSRPDGEATFLKDWEDEL